MPRLEGSVEESFGNWLTKHHKAWIYRKFTPEGSNGWPDRDIIGPDAHVIYVEWKRPGEEPEPLQLHRHVQLRNRGHTVYVWDDLEAAKESFRYYLHTEGLPRGGD